MFQCRPIQKKIDFNYPLVQKYTVRRLLMPYVVFLLMFVFYTNYIYEVYYNAKAHYDIHIANGSPAEPITSYQFLFYGWLGMLVAFATYFV